MTTNMAGETVEGKGNECIFRNHGITLRSKTDVLDGVRITSRCLRYEQNDFGLSDSENLCSKLYLLRVENCDIMLKVRVKLPIFQGASECEELVMKTDRGKEVKVTKTKRSKRKVRYTCSGEELNNTLQASVLVLKYLYHTKFDTVR